jgi:hypothetical protein
MNAAAQPPAPPRCTFEFDPATGAVGWRVEGHFPLPFLVNALEMAKNLFVAQQVQGARAAGRPGLLLPDGSPAGLLPP